MTLVLLSGACAMTAHAQSLSLSATLELSQVYLPDRWQPVRLEFRNTSDRAIDGSAMLPLADEKAPALMKLPVNVPAHSTVRATIWGYFPRTTAAAQRRPSKQGAGQAQPPLTIAEWRGSDGSLLSRAPMLGIPLSSNAAGEEGAEETGELIAIVNATPEAPADIDDAGSLANSLKDSIHIPLATCVLTTQTLTREPSGLRSLKAIVLQDVDPEAFDVAQRDALTNYLRGGGIVVIPAPNESFGRGGSWLAQLLPVRVIGHRLADQIETSSHGAAPALKFSEPVQISEAIEASGQTLLRGKDYVHVAFRQIGLGKIVFTSFPINALDDSQPQVATLWQELLGLNQPAPSLQWNKTQLAEARYPILSEMIGRKVAPWSVAAAVVGGYLLVLLAVQATFRGAARPRAFVVGCGAAMLLSVVLVGMGMTRRSSQSLQGARLAVIDVSPDGGGCERDSLAYSGADERDMPLGGADERVMIRPASADPSNPPTIRQQPFNIEKAGVLVERIDRVWELDRPLDPGVRVQVIGRFGPNGLSIESNNSLGQSIVSPLLVFNRRAMAMADLPVGQATLNALHVNNRDDFTNSTMITSDLAKRRAEIVRASITPAVESDSSPISPPILIGWVNAPIDAGLVRVPDDVTVDRKAMTMVRTPIQIEPPATGTQLSIPAALVSIDTGRLPYDAAKGETVPSQEQGEWPISFATPSQLGSIKPTHAAFELRVTLPQQTLILRKRSGERVAQWTREVGSKQVSFDLGPQDYDGDGRVWLTLEIQGATGSPWQTKDLGMSIEAVAVAPPSPLSFHTSQEKR